jgi:hypothetical protein
LLLSLIWSFVRACLTAQQVVRVASTTDERFGFLHNVADALLKVVAVDLFFSFASYGLSEPYWYFIGGVSVVTARLAVRLAPRAPDEDRGTRAESRIVRRFRGRLWARAPGAGRVRHVEAFVV